jgi:hypothetical protein
MLSGAMGGDAPQPSRLESGLAPPADRWAAAVVLVVGCHVADAGVQPDAVVVLANTGKFGPQGGGSPMASRWGYSALTWPNSDSTHAWSIGVPGRPKC